MYCRNCGRELAAGSILCTNCGVPPPKGNKFCQNCGSVVDPLADACVRCGVWLASSHAQTVLAQASLKSRTVTTLLAFFLGEFGAHRFYLGKNRTAISMLVLASVGYLALALRAVIAFGATMSRVAGLYSLLILLVGLLFLGVAIVWSLVDFVVSISGDMKDKEGKLIKNW